MHQTKSYEVREDQHSQNASHKGLEDVIMGSNSFEDAINKQLGNAGSMNVEADPEHYMKSWRYHIVDAWGETVATYKTEREANLMLKNIYDKFHKVVAWEPTERALMRLESESREQMRYAYSGPMRPATAPDQLGRVARPTTVIRRTKASKPVSQYRTAFEGNYNAR